MTNFPLIINLNQVQYVDAAMGEFAVDMKVIGRPEYGECIRYKQFLVPIALRESAVGIEIIAFEPASLQKFVLPGRVFPDVENLGSFQFKAC